MKPSSIVPPVKRYRPRSGMATSTATIAEPEPCAERAPVAGGADRHCRRARTRCRVARPCVEEASRQAVVSGVAPSWDRVDLADRRRARSVAGAPAGRRSIGTPSRRWSSRLPLLVAVVDLQPHHWYPVLDLAMTEFRVRDVFTPAHAADRAARPDRRVPEPGQPSRPAQLLPAGPDVPPARVDGVGAARRRPSSSTSPPIVTALWIGWRRPAGAGVAGVGALLAAGRSAATGSCC